MSTFHKPIGLACGLVLCTAAGSALSAVRYDCQRLQTTGYSYAWTTAINSAGEVSGFGDFDPDRNATRWAVDGSATELDDLGEYGSANGINDSGWVVGYSYTAGFEQRVPVLWKGTTPESLPLLPGDVAGDAYHVNNRGLIVGVSRAQEDGKTRAVLWRHGKAVNLGLLGQQAGQASRSSLAASINEHGMIVGYSDTDSPDSTHAVWWDANRQIHDLGTLPGARQSWAHDVNDRGVIVGAGEVAGGSPLAHAVAWVDGAVQDLGVLPGHTESRAYAVNRSGTVVGVGWKEDVPFGDVALVWPRLNAAPRDLNTLLTPSCQVVLDSYKLIRASGINRDGAIAATGQYLDPLGGVHYGPFKLVPVLE